MEAFECLLDSDNLMFFTELVRDEEFCRTPHAVRPRMASVANPGAPLKTDNRYAN